EWTRTQEADAIEQALQGAGVPAHVVAKAGDLARDPHINAGYMRKIIDPVIGEAEIEGPRFTLFGTPHVETRRGPRTGEHSQEVMRDICGFSEKEIAELVDMGALV